MFKKVMNNELEYFRIIYHQTTGYSNPIIESVLYSKRKTGNMYFWGDMIEGNYMIFHNSGWSHINFNSYYQHEQNTLFFQKLDQFIKFENSIPDYLMLYNTPESLIDYWSNKDKKYL